MADERTAKASELEQKLALLEVERHFTYFYHSFCSMAATKYCLKLLLQLAICYQVECANLNQELQDMEARARRGQKKPPEEANQTIQVFLESVLHFTPWSLHHSIIVLTAVNTKMQVWQEEVERARQGQRDAEGKLSSLEVSTLCLLHNTGVMINLYL